MQNKRNRKSEQGSTAIVTHCDCHAGCRHAIAAVLQDPTRNSKEEIFKRERSFWS